MRNLAKSTRSGALFLLFVVGNCVPDITIRNKNNSAGGSGAGGEGADGGDAGTMPPGGSAGTAVGGGSGRGGTTTSGTSAGGVDATGGSRAGSGTEGGSAGSAAAAGDEGDSGAAGAGDTAGAGGASAGGGMAGLGGAAGAAGSSTAGKGGTGGSCSTGSAVGWTDEFDAATVDSAWTVWQYAGTRHNGLSSPANHISLTSRPGSLRYVVDPMTHPAYQHDYAEWYDGTNYYYDPGLELSRELVGTRWTVQVGATWYLPLVVNSAWFDVMAHFGPPGTAGMTCGVQRFSYDDVGAGTNPDGNRIFAGCYGGDNSWQEWAGLETSIARHVRLDRDENSLVINISRDAVTWDDVLTVPLPSQFGCSQQHLLLSGGAWFSPQGSYADYEYVMFRPHGGTGATFRDDFDRAPSPLNWVTAFTQGASSVYVNGGAVTLDTTPNNGCATVEISALRRFSVLDGTVTFESRVLDTYVDQGIYGNAQPRGLVAGADRNNAIEFINAPSVPNHVACRTVAGGAVTETVVDIGQSVRAPAVYKIVASSGSVAFYVNGNPVATHTTNIPTAALNAYFGTSDGCTGNVPVVVDWVTVAQ
jgi:hypothetical protein